MADIQNDSPLIMVFTFGDKRAIWTIYEDHVLEFEIGLILHQKLILEWWLLDQIYTLNGHMSSPFDTY